jgi:hypothetical protein
MENNTTLPEQTEVTPFNDAGLSAESNLQQEMTGDFFTYDDGFGSFVQNDTSMPPVDKSGNPVTLRNKEDLDSFLTKTNQAKKPQPQAQSAKQGEQPKPNENIIRAFEKDGKPDFQSIDDAVGRFKNFSYPVQPIIEPPKGQQSTTPKPVLSPRESIKAEIENFKKTYAEDYLTPLQKVWEKCASQGAIPGDATHVALNELYLERSEKLADLIDSKKEELQNKQDELAEEKEKFGDFTKSAVRNFSDTANEFFPNSEPSKRTSLLEQFIFGIQKDGKIVQRGYGVDAIHAFFDQSNSGKKFSSTEELNSAYEKWWTRFSSVPQNIKLIAQLAFGQYQLQNHTAIRDGFRTKWDLEQQQKLNQSQAPASAKAGNAGTIDQAQLEIDRFMSAPKPRS